MTDFRMPEPRPYNERFWAAASDGRLLVQRCPACETYVYPPRSACPECFDDLEWVESDGKGTVYSYTLVHHPDPPEVVDDADLPMVGCVVELTEGVRVASRLQNCEPDGVEIGMHVVVTFDETPDGRAIPTFEPA